MFRHGLDHVISCAKSQEIQDMGNEIQIIVVTQYPEIQALLEKEAQEGILQVAINEHSERGISSSIQVGLSLARPQDEYFMFVVGDQPYLTKETLKNFLMTYLQSGNMVGCVTNAEHLP